MDRSTLQAAAVAIGGRLELETSALGVPDRVRVGLSVTSADTRPGSLRRYVGVVNWPVTSCRQTRDSGAAAAAAGGAAVQLILSYCSRCRERSAGERCAVAPSGGGSHNATVSACPQRWGPSHGWDSMRGPLDISHG